MHARSYFWSLIVSLYFVAGGDVCPGASPAAKGPSLRSQPVSGLAEKRAERLGHGELDKMS